MMRLEDILTISALITGVVAVFELLEYVFTKNIPWLARLLTNLFRWLRRRFWRKVPPPDRRYIALNFSSHPVLPGQRQAIQTKLNWPTIEVLEARLGNVPEDKKFVSAVLKYVDQIDLLPLDWQAAHLVVIAAGYAPAWSILLAELHGRLGYFPDWVRLRPAPAGAEEKFEVVDIVSLREIRNRARGKR